MNDQLLEWLKNNKGHTLESPRGKKTYSIKITEINEELKRIKIKFVGGTPALPLFFWMFDRALAFIKANKGSIVRLGAKVKRPFDPDTVEGKIWEEPLLYPTPYKAAPHVCDLLVLAGLAKYQKTRNPVSRRIVQGIKYAACCDLFPRSSQSKVGAPIKTINKKEDFIKKYKQTIVDWVMKNEGRIVTGLLSYSWGNKPTSECVHERNEVSKAIIMSRIRNYGGVDLDTLDKVIRWGFNKDFPMRDAKRALKVTREAFDYLEEGELKDATITLLNIEGVGISRASKILGLFDQENLCIYDSRVGKALKDLKSKNEKIIPCPPGRTYPGDQGLTDGKWAENYQRLIWTLEIVRDYLNGKGHTYRLADVEMGLFMVGKTD
jgi:hypothetical protein